VAEGISFSFLGVAELRAAFDKTVVVANERTLATITEAAKLVQVIGRDKAPRLTGALAKSIRIEGPTRTGLTSYMAVIGPSVPYGRRVEWGFKGPDSLGRMYNQRPRPYFVPAGNEARALFPEIYRKHMLAGLWG
jgi:hypothetical protein